jgi:glycosyltransferase involved in cell wall biosynthesis
LSRAGLQCAAARLRYRSESGKTMQLVSVYIPTRNRSRLLARAVQSVLDQTYSHLEIIIVDDASGDDTEEAVKKLIAANDTSKRIMYFRLAAPAGACAARNVAIEAATGEYITGLDDDDYFLPERIFELVQAFDPAACAFVFDGYLRETVQMDGGVRRRRVPLGREVRLADLLKRNTVGNQVLTLTERMRQLGGFDVSLPAWQDYDMWIRLVRKFGKGRGTKGLTYIQTVSGDIPRISNELERVSKAFDIFRLTHPEYEDPRLLSCLRLSKSCYGMDALQLVDLLNIMSVGKPRLIASSWFFFLSSKLSSN